MKKTAHDNEALAAAIEKPQVDGASSHSQSGSPAIDDSHANLARVDDAIEAIGWGKYQWQLALTCGFGFLADQMLLVAISVVTPQASMEFSPKYPLYLAFLPYYLAANGAALGNSSNYITYRDFAVSSVVGIIGPAISMYMVSTRLRSRISIAITAAACVAFAGAFTTVKSEAQNLAFSSMLGLWLNAVYSIIYGYTPQALDVEHRGLGAGLLMSMARISSLSAPFIATFADVRTSAPIWVACGCYGVIGLSALILPVDTAMFSRKSK
ncbi:hypothetical protein JDV02_010236 [Purpureocillium takamizusanense]|uniref:Membrane transporter n=1 Tax=Purpureocillium takamizusanense TaxID=2060973 RepID=A0A9Q8QTE3_9HYPO|nr:uncharacterized protein JDV02_010236 [Purpureocillium takamizusanense]UNI24496.1 hypothetical protein JDV02_010236 [Purpureocillium takamizusanense]